MELVRGEIKISWVDLDEGLLNSPYNPEDPDDYKVLRFKIYTLDSEENWIGIPEGSWPTRFPVTSSKDQQWIGLRYLMDEIHSPVRRGEDTYDLCRELSLIEPDWLDQEENVFSC